MGKADISFTFPNQLEAKYRTTIGEYSHRKEKNVMRMINGEYGWMTDNFVAM